MSEQKERGNIVELFGRALTADDFDLPDSPELQLRNAIEKAGYFPPDQVYLDGEIHRFSIDGSYHDKSGWYVAFSDGIPAGVYGNWKEDSRHSWRSDIGRELTAYESMEVASQLRKAALIREEARKVKQEAAAETCLHRWNNAQEAPSDHPYLQKKGVQPHGARMASDGKLMLPLYDKGGQLSSLQYISPDGSKKFQAGGKAGGCFWWLGDMQGSSKVFIAEGFATAASIHEATGHPVVISYNAKNMIPVTGAIREHLPGASLVLVADNDESATGQKCAYEAAEKYGAEVIIPPDTGDANDYAQAGGDLSELLQTKAESWHEFVDDFCKKPSPLKWLVKHWLQENSLAMVYGPSGCGKTFLVLDWMLRIASGQSDWMGHKVKQGDVFYLCGEGHYGVKSRIAAWKQHHGVSKIGNMIISKSATDLDSPMGLNKVISSIRESSLQPSLIVIDTLNRFLSGDENSAKDSKVFIDSCALLQREFQCTVLIIHHTGVSAEAQHRARGSSSWRGVLDIQVQVEAGQNNQSIKVIQKKAKDTQEAETVHIDLHQVEIDGWKDEDGEQVTSAVVVEGMAPTEKLRDSKQRERIQDMIAAWEFSGAEDEDGIPYITTSAWKDYIKHQNPEIKESTIRQKFKSSAERTMISRMIEDGIVQEYQAGYLVIDEEIASAMMLSKPND